MEPKRSGRAKSVRSKRVRILRTVVYTFIIAFAFAFLFGGVALASPTNNLDSFEPIKSWFCEIAGIEQDSPTTRTVRGRLGSTPTVALVTPLDGATLNYRDVEVEFDVTNFNAGSIGTPHVHFHLDNDPLPFMFFNGNDPTQFGQQAALFDFDFTSRATWVSPDTIRFNALSNGDHTITINLVDDQHNVYGNAEATLTFTFSVDVPPDDLLSPDAIVFVKEQPNPAGMGRVFDNDPDIVSDLYLLSPPTPAGTLTQLTDVAINGGGVSDPEVSFDGTRILFSMRLDDDDTWHVWEINTDGTGLRQVTFDPPYNSANDIDPIYLPDGRIMFASDRLKQRDEYNVNISTQLYTANADGSDIILVEPNPSHDHNPQLIQDGRIVFDRWDHLQGRNEIVSWHMNQDGSSGFSFFGGASPRGSEQLGTAQGIERRQLVDGQMVGIFTDRDTLPGAMGVFDNRNGDLEDLPAPIVIGPTGLYRTPHPLTTQELVYSYADETDPLTAEFGLWTMPWSAENVLHDDDTVETAPGPGTDNTFRAFFVNMDAPGRLYVEVTGSADANGASDDDDLWVWIDGVEYKNVRERKLDGDLIEGLVDTFRVDADVPAGNILIQVTADETPTIHRIRVVQAMQPGTPSLLYDDPATNEISPIPVRVTTPPPVYPSRVNPDLSWGTFVVRDVSLRGDFRQPNHDDPEGDPNFNFHLDLDKLAGLRVVQSVARRSSSADELAGAHQIDPVRVLGIAPQNEFGTIVFQAPANNVTAWDLIGHEGEAIVHERVWSLVQPGEVRACGGCHVPQMPFTQRDIGPFPAPTDLRTRGEVYEFTEHVLPILQETCQGCHLGASPAGGLDLFGDRPTFDALFEEVIGRTPEEYIDLGDTRKSFLFQLLTGDARGNATHQTRIDTINTNVDHTTLVSAENLYNLGTWIDTSSGFAYMRQGEGDGTPHVVGILPSVGATAVADNSGIVVTFSAPIDRATLNDTTFSVESATRRAPVSGDWSWGDNRTVIFRPNAPFLAGEYTLTIQDLYDIKDDTPRVQMAVPFTTNFFVTNGSDAVAPQIVELPSATALGRADAVVVRFNEPIDATTIDELSLWVEADNGAFVEGDLGVSTDGMEASFNPLWPLDSDVPYTLYVTTDILDLAGNPLASAVTHNFIVAPQASPYHYGLRIDRETENSPEKIAISPDGSRVLVSNQSSSDTISVYDGTTWELLTTWDDVGNEPFGVAFSADNSHAYVINTADEEFRILDASDGTVLATIDSGMANPRLMTVNHAGDRVYIADTGDPDAIHEVDVESGSPTFGQILQTLITDRSVRDVTISADDQTIYYSSNSNNIGVINVALWVELDEIDVPLGSGEEIVLSPDGRQVVVTSRDNDQLQVADTIARQHSFNVPLGDYPESVVFSPDGNFIYVAERLDRTIAVVDAATLTVVDRLAATDNRLIEGLAISADGLWLYAVMDGGPGKLRVFSISDFSDTTAPQLISVSPDNESNLSTFSPIFVEFSETIDRFTLTNDTVRLEHNGVEIGGELNIDDANTAVWFLPGISLQPDTTYTIRVTTAVQDLAGNPLSAETATTFTTAAEAETPVYGRWAEPWSGTSPYGVAASLDGSLVLGTDYFAHDVYFIDTATWSSSVLDLGADSEFIAINPAGSMAYVTHPGPNNVVVVDVATQSVVTTIAVGTTPERALHHPNQARLYVANRDSGDVSVINTNTNVEIARWPVNGIGSADLDARGLTLSADNQQLFVTADDSLSILNASTGALINRYTNLPGSDIYGVVLTPDGNQAWVASDSGELLAIDLRIGEIVAQVSVGNEPKWLTLHPDGETLYVNNQVDGTISMVQWRTGIQLGTISILGEVRDIALSADGNFLYAASLFEDAILAYRLADSNDATAPAVATIDPTAGSDMLNVLQPLVVTFDEAIDRATINNFTFYVLEDGRALEEAAVSGEYAFSADNETITFTPDQPWQAGATYTLYLTLGITDIAGNNLAAPVSSDFTLATNVPPITLSADATIPSDDPYGIALSPDGDLLVVANRWADTLSWLDPDTLAPLDTPLTVGNEPRGLAFSADGSQLFVAHDLDNSLLVIDVATRQTVNVYTGLTDAEHVTLSLDGTIAYLTGYDAGGVNTVDLTTGQVTNQVQTMTRPGHARYAPDGTLYVPADDELWRLNPDDSWTGLQINGDYAVDVAFSGDSRFAYVGQTWSDRIRVVDLVLWQVAHDLSVGDEPREMVVSADNRILIVANASDSTLQVIDLLTLNTVQTVPVSGAWFSSLLWDEDRQRVYAGSTIGEQVHVFNIDYCATCAPTATTLSTITLNQHLWTVVLLTLVTLLTSWTWFTHKRRLVVRP